MSLTAKEADQLEDLVQEKNALVLMVKTKGWDAMLKEFSKVSEVAYEKLVQSQEGFEAGKHLGAFHVAESVKTWPVRRIHQIDALLTNLDRAVSQRQRK